MNMKLYCTIYHNEIVISNKKMEHATMSGSATAIIEYLIAWGLDLSSAIIVVFGVVNRTELKPMNSYTCSINY